MKLFGLGQSKLRSGLCDGQCRVYVINCVVMSMRELMHDLRMRWLAEHAGTSGTMRASSVCSEHSRKKQVRSFTLIITQVLFVVQSALACVIYCKLYAANSRSH